MEDNLEWGHAQRRTPDRFPSARILEQLTYRIVIMMKSPMKLAEAGRPDWRTFSVPCLEASCVNLTIRMNHMMLPCLQQQSVHIGVPCLQLLSLNGFAIHIKQHPTIIQPFPTLSHCSSLCWTRKYSYGIARIYKERPSTLERALGILQPSMRRFSRW